MNCGLIAGEDACVTFESWGLIPVMLLAQKMVFSFSRSADFEVGGFWGDYYVCTVDGKFAVDAVADGGGEGNHGRDRGGAEEDGRASEGFAAFLAEEGFSQEAEEHGASLGKGFDND